MVKQAMALFTLALMALLSVGCCDSSLPRNVTVELDQAMRDQLMTRKVEVHIVALNTNQNERWKDYSMNKYWQPGDVVRESVPTFKMVFDPTNTNAQTLKADDPIWKKWFDASSGEKNMQLYVLALLPSANDDAPGSKDPRRQILPLNCQRWKGPGQNSTIKIKVQPTGIITMTPPDPEDN